MAGKPLIGITMDYRASRKEHAALSFVAAGYYDGVMASGGIPIALPPVSEEEDLVRLLDMLDGVVLVGGGDIDPRRDGYMPHPATRPMDARREDFDRMLVAEICRRQMPVLAIGSGMQLLNVNEGGTVFLHIPEDLPKALPIEDAERTRFLAATGALVAMLETAPNQQIALAPGGASTGG